MKAKQPLSIDEIKDRILPILMRYGAKRAGLFGSVVRGQARKRSDVDVLVEIDRRISLLEFVRLERELAQVLGRKVDLVEYEAVKPIIRERVLVEEVRIL